MKADTPTYPDMSASLERRREARRRAFFAGSEDAVDEAPDLEGWEGANGPPDGDPRRLSTLRHDGGANRRGMAAAPGSYGDDAVDFGNDGFQEEASEAPRFVLVISWLALAFAVMGLGAMLYFDRGLTVRTLPGAATLYARLGIPVNARGLEFDNVTYKWDQDSAGRPRLGVTGEVRNITRDPIPVPTVVLEFLDADRGKLYHWTSTVAVNTLPAGETTPFSATVPGPPDAARSLRVRFAGPAD
jgi:hypothetical protein